MALTPNEKKDLRQAWNHLYKADEILETVPRAQCPGVFTARQEISDAKRIIDRVEQERMPGVSMELRLLMIKKIGDQIAVTHSTSIPDEWSATMADAAIKALLEYKG